MRIFLKTLSVSVILFLIGFGYFSYKIKTMDIPASLLKTDGVIVLTGAERRIATGLLLLKSGRSKHLLISGVNKTTNRNTLRQSFPQNTSLFKCCIDLGWEATNTRGNAQESATWLKSHHYHRVYLVTHDYHMPRALYELHRLTPEVEFIAYPVHNTSNKGGAWNQWRLLISEYIKFLGSVAWGSISNLWDRISSSAI
ncbi:YdcF family protein [Bartonella sp. DGB2]|uniref:YdcF family protein n=1 Tax=Bartonella sp. DGB2 TaxID=3388426 RepID=UPI00398FCC28